MKSISKNIQCDRLIRCRYELKYRISDFKATAIRRFIKPHLPPDRYCKLQPNLVYPIVSLYLDSGNLHLCKESLTGKKNRFKLRIRSYTDETDYPYFFEIKRRINRIIVKSRAQVARRNIATLLSGIFVSPENKNGDAEALNQFQLYMKNIDARPVIKVRYLREAYEDDSHHRVRVTFDRQLSYKTTNLPEVSLNGSSWQRHPLLNGVILEIKFTSYYPIWLSQMVKHFNLERQSVSKYTHSIRQSRLLGFCAPQRLEFEL